MSASSHCRILIDSGIVALISQLGIVSKLWHLAGDAKVIDIYDQKEGPQNSPRGNTTANSGPVKSHTIYDDPLPPSCQPIFGLGRNISLVA